MTFGNVSGTDKSGVFPAQPLYRETSLITSCQHTQTNTALTRRNVFLSVPVSVPGHLSPRNGYHLPAKHTCRNGYFSSFPRSNPTFQKVPERSQPFPSDTSYPFPPSIEGEREVRSNTQIHATKTPEPT